MSVMSWLRQTLTVSYWLCAVTSLVSTYVPLGVRKWDEHLAERARETCRRVSGVAVVSADGVVSCSPGPALSVRAP